MARYKLGVNPNIKGKSVYCGGDGGNVNIRKIASTNIDPHNGTVLFTKTKEELIGPATSRQLLPLVKGEQGWIEVSTSKGLGWVRYDFTRWAKPVQAVATGDGKALMENITRRDYDTYHKLIESKAILSEMKAKGKNTKALETKLQAVESSYTTRRKKIEGSRMVKFQTGLQKGFDRLLKKIGIGALPVGALVIGGMVLLVAGAEIYRAFQPDLKRSEVDQETAGKVLDEINKAATPEEKKKVVQIKLQEQYDKGSAEGAAQAAEEAEGGLTGGLKAGTNMLLVGGAIFLATKFF